MRYLIIIICIAAAALSCQPEEEFIAGEAVGLRFEMDTVAFDTLFTTEQSITKRLRVYNPSRKSVLIDYIGLDKGVQSPYQIYINGVPGKEFGEQQLIGGDSLLVLLEAKLPATSDTLPYLASDYLTIRNKGLQQQIPVLGYGQNAQFFSDSLLICNEVWDSPLPYVFDKSVVVDSLCTLTIAKGSKLYFKPGATLYVKGSLVAEGDTAQTDRILFRAHRSGEGYDYQPGQWGGIIFMPGTKDNKMLFCNVRNASYGIYLDSPDENDVPELEMGNCRIENNLWGGIICFNSDLLAYNTLVHSSARYTVANIGGGSYSYEHCTFINSFGQRETVPVLYLSANKPSAEAEENGTKEPGFLKLSLLNSIIWGNGFQANEILLDVENEANVALEFSNNLLRTTDPFWQGNNNITGKDYSIPNFRNSFPFDYSPDTLSPAIDAAIPLGYQYDLNGTLRDQQPDIGAFEYVPVPETEEGQK